MNLIALDKELEPGMLPPDSIRENRLSPTGALRHAWNFFKSIRLAIILMLLLAATAVIGTFIPQNQDMAAYVKDYPEALLKLFVALDLFDMYHSSWFRMLLVGLIINIVVCSADRLKKQKKIIFNRSPGFAPSRFKNIGHHMHIPATSPAEPLKARCMEVLNRRFRHVITEKNGNTIQIFAEKGRWTRFGVYIIHASIILLAMGAVIGSMFGFEGYVAIPEGRTINHITQQSGDILHLPFSIKCDAFNVSFYDSQAPKDYCSSLSVIEAGRHVMQKDIRVNDPLRYEGVSFFQSNYGTLPPEKITFSFTSADSGKIFTREISTHQKTHLPENLGSFMLMEVINAYSFGGRNLGEAVVCLLEKEGREPETIIVPFRYPEFDKMRSGDFSAAITDYDLPYYTGLRVSKDPGVGLVYAGFLFLIAGCIITFWMSHQRLLVTINKEKGRFRITVAGIANRNEITMNRKVQQICRQLMHHSNPSAAGSIKI